MRLRQATDADLAQVMTWIRDPETCRLWAGPQVRFPLQLDRLKRDIMYTPENTVVMIGDDDQPSGVAQLMARPRGGVHLARIAVAPDYRGQGYGERLVRLLIQESVRRHQARFVSLKVDHYNHVAQNLYRKLGFQAAAEPSDVLPDSQTLYMILALGPKPV
jgi:ribosomal protein S18 acetylase RimI-like enzyme